MSKSIVFNWKAGLAGLACMMLVNSASAIEMAGTLFVDLDARHVSAGSPTWINTAPGSAAVGNFIESAAGLTGDESSNPMVVNLGPKNNRAVSFNGSSDVYTSQLPAPGGLIGPNPTRTVETWVFNPAPLVAEETMVAWGHRGGPEGTNFAFNYGNQPTFGAAGQWGAGPDMGWGPGGAPTAGQWQQLTYVHDGTSTAVYQNGVLKSIENHAGLLNTHAGSPIALASQFDNATALTGGVRGNLALANVRVHDGALTGSQVQANFLEDATRFLSPAGSPIPIHRYSFDGTGGIGAQLTDSIGGAHGVLRGNDASALTGSGQLNLGGGSSASAGYGDLPNGLVSGLTNATLETWATWENASQNWTRLFDFGDNTAGEVVGPGGSFSGNGAGGDGYFFLTPGSGTGGNMLGGVYEPGVGETQAVAGFRTGAGVEHHFAYVFDDTNDLLQIYFDGVLSAQASIPGRSLAQVLDINNWLGRSNFSGDANFDGLLNEFRIYDVALSGDQVIGNFLAGPSALNAVPEPATALLGIFGASLLAMRRRRMA